MLTTAIGILAVAAFLVTLAAMAWSKPALAIAVLLLTIIELLRLVPVGR